MTTRAGFAGLITGLIATLIIYPIFITSPQIFVSGDHVITPSILIVASVIVILMIGGGWFAARWSGSTHTGRSAALGGLSGGLAGSVVFCLWGAGYAGGMSQFDRATMPQIEIIETSIRQTMDIFLALFIGGSGLGALGGCIFSRRHHNRTEIFDKTEPQMALNAAITALPASIVAAAMAGAVLSRLADYLASQAGQTGIDNRTLEIPLVVSLLLVFVSHMALTLVVPHEARQAEHLCGMDEVKMGAYVSIGAAPLLVLLLILVDANSFSNPLVMIALLASSCLSLISLLTLYKLILPGRATFPAPWDGRQKTEAKLFGSIANSQGPRLVLLCIGCGMLMVLPLYLTVFSVLINLSNVMGISTIPFIPEGVYKPFLVQALVSTGMITATIIALTLIYLFYLNLGRSFSKWNSHNRG
jgi:hypothetical protein